MARKPVADVEGMVKAGAQVICASRTVNCQQAGCCAFYEDHARLALAAVCANPSLFIEPAIYAHQRLPSGRYSDFHDKNSVHMDGCIPLYDLTALGQEMGEP